MFYIMTSHCVQNEVALGTRSKWMTERPPARGDDSLELGWKWGGGGVRGWGGRGWGW